MPPPPPPAIYASLAGERALRARYTAALAGLPFPHHERLVITDSYGAVHVTMAGHPAAAPLLLWHAAALPGPLLLAAFAPLASRFRVIAPDFPCQREQGLPVRHSVLGRAEAVWGHAVWLAGGTMATPVPLPTLQLCPPGCLPCSRQPQPASSAGHRPPRLRPLVRGGRRGAGPDDGAGAGSSASGRVPWWRCAA